IGRAVAEALCRAGALTVLHGRDEGVLSQTAEAFRAAGLKVSTVAADVTDEAATKAALEGIVARHGRLDILVNNAGVTSRAPVLQQDTEGWRGVIEGDLTACFVLAREAGRGMAAAGWGRIINIASVAGLIAAPGRVSYIAAKHGLIGLTRSLALELGG